MKTQITVLAFVGAILLGGGYLLGANAKPRFQTNKEPYILERGEWAEVWLNLEASTYRHYTDMPIWTSFSLNAVEDHDVLVCTVIYRDSVAVVDVREIVDWMRESVAQAIDSFSLDVDIKEHIVNMDDKKEYDEYVKWMIESNEKTKEELKNLRMKKEAKNLRMKEELKNLRFTR